MYLSFFSSLDDWKCNSGQGESGKRIHYLKSISLDMCGRECLQFDGCIGFDYANTANCRMFGQNTPRTDPGVDNRTYCSNSKIF